MRFLVLALFVYVAACGDGTKKVGAPADAEPASDVEAADATKDAIKPPKADALPIPDTEPPEEDAPPVTEDTAEPPPDVATVCTKPADCPGGACNQLTGDCVGCLTPANCPEGAKCIDLACVADVPCDSDKDCPGGVCDFDLAVCVECLTGADCADGELCAGQACEPAPTPCESSKDCAELEMVCDKTAKLCVDCVADADCVDDQWCAAQHCQPKVCVAGFVQCLEDGAHACLENGSAFGPAESCADTDPCTDDGCKDGPGCVHTPSAGPCDDFNACTDGDACGETGCVPGPAFDCADGDPCTTDACDPVAGCSHAPSAGPCEDGDACTAGDTCAGGTCVPGAGPDCDDGTPCTTDACVAGAGCTHAPAAGPCEDGNACTLGDFCSLGACKPGASVASCDDKSDCTVDACDPKKGCVYAPSTAKGCCTKASDCADGNLCTQSVCDAEGSCSFPPAPGSCDDGDLCTDGDVCNAGACGGVDKDCDDKNPCTFDGCVTVSGCTHVPKGGKCGEGGTCVQGVCCIPSCGAKTCGDDGCGGSCGGCGAGTTCGAAGACVPCSCEGKLCGDDGCGTLCGACAAGLTCTSLGQCAPPEGICTGECTGQTTDAMLCAIDLCAKESVVSAAVASPTGSNIASAWTAVTHFGSETNDLAPKKGGSYALLATGPATGTSHSSDLGGQQIADPFVSGSSVHNAIELQLTLKAPAGVTGLSVRYVYLSVEFEEYVGSQFSDKFYIVVNGAVANTGPCSGDQGDLKGEGGKPLCYIGPNSGFAEKCAAPATNIAGTGFECGTGGGQNGSKDGSSTGWLRTSWAVEAGATIAVTFHLHDTGDGIYDSEVILDALEWRTDAFTPGTVKD